MTLVALKLTVGFLIGSVAILSEAIHSAVDLVAALIALFSVRTASLPADGRHPFGHGKIENLSGTAEAVLIFVAAGWILWEAAAKLRAPQAVEAIGWGVLVMLLSAGANVLVSRRLFQVGQETDSIALMADGWHLRTDVYTSAGVMAGLAILWAGERLFPGTHLHWLDPVAAIVVAMLILKAAWSLLRQSAGGLLDETLPDEEEAAIRRILQGHCPVIHGYHQLRTRKAGPFRFVEVHIQVDPQMSVATSHRLSQDLVREIRQTLPQATVTVHVEPCDGRCAAKCLAGCLLNAGGRAAVRQAQQKAQG
jgi:cation diffusion facilitator family transporter